MSGDGYGHDSAESIRTRAAWKELGESMGRAGEQLAGASSSGLPPAVTGAADAFLTTWRDLTTRSRGIADDFAASLAAIDRRYAQADDEAKARFDALRGRLGPA